MRHNYKGRKLGTDFAHTKAMKRSLVQALFLNDRIKTIESRAKEIRPDVDKIITDPELCFTVFEAERSAEIYQQLRRMPDSLIRRVSSFFSYRLTHDSNTARAGAAKEEK